VGVDGLRRGSAKGKAPRGLRAVRPHLVANLVLGLSFLFVPDLSAQRTQLKPGWNMFSPQQDIEVGKRAATDAEKQLPLCPPWRVCVCLSRRD
jgi:hypothetical protein